MKSVNQMSGLGDMKTTISTHSRSTPRQKGSTFLDVYLLDKERQRLESEMAMLKKRQRRIEVRLGDIRQAMGGLLSDSPAPATATPAPDVMSDKGDKGNKDSGGVWHRWRQVPAEY